MSLSPVVFLHAFPLGPHMWRAQQEALPGHRCLTVDLRGDAHQLVDLLVDRVIATLDAAAIDRAVVCGLSMGGYVALRLVERNPERVRALVLADTRADADSDEIKLKRAEHVRKLKAGSVEAFLDGLLPNLLGKKARENAELVGRVRKMALESTSAALQDALIALAARTDTTRALAKITVPTLLLFGEEDKVTPPELGHAMRDEIPGAKLTLLPEAGHLSNLESPAAFNASLATFLTSLSAR